MRDIYMVYVGPGGTVFVKELSYFRSTGGFIQPWGLPWAPVVATDIEDARMRGCELAGARPYGRQIVGGEP
jgi:hypothetical protein